MSSCNVINKGLSRDDFHQSCLREICFVAATNEFTVKAHFPYHFKKIIVQYKKIGYNLNVMRQTACLVVNPIKVNSFAYLFNCTTVGRTSD